MPFEKVNAMYRSNMIKKLDKGSNCEIREQKINEIIEVVNKILSELSEEYNYKLEQKEREE